jgi:predicted DNA-binding transcriptional regulator AlpA
MDRKVVAMTITLTSQELESIVTKAMLNVISPWLTMDDMMTRYHVKTTHTITAMERRGEIPQRAKTGLWLRSEVNDWTASKKAA